MSAVAVTELVVTERQVVEAKRTHRVEVMILEVDSYPRKTVRMEADTRQQIIAWLGSLGMIDFKRIDWGAL